MDSMLPLHVQVSAALGWTKPYDRGDGLWMAIPPGGSISEEVPPYDRSWCKTGPLLERFELGVFWFQDYMKDCKIWVAYIGPHPHLNYSDTQSVQGDTPTKAISKLVLELQKVGKLNV
jgi:hypothetical protein